MSRSVEVRNAGSPYPKTQQSDRFLERKSGWRDRGAGGRLFTVCSLPAFFAACVWCYVAFFQKINKIQIQKLCDFYAGVQILDAKCKMKPWKTSELDLPLMCYC